MQKRTHKLLFKFGALFAVFAVVAIVIGGIVTYMTQSRIYRKQQEQNIRSIADYMTAVLSADGFDFPLYQNYIIANHDDTDIPADFTEADILRARKTFETMFAREHPGKALRYDVDFSELSDELRTAYAVYNHEYYLDLFEKAADRFGIAYVYYLVPTGAGRHMYYVLDPTRETREDGFLDLCIDADEPAGEHRKMWEAWETGSAPNGYDTYDNEYGKTLAWYTPLYIDGTKLGVIGAEVEISDYNRTLAVNTFTRFIPIVLVLLAAIAAVLWFINRFYILRIQALTRSIEEYTLTKNTRIAGEIEQNMSQDDEISVLGRQTASMILELDNYLKSLVETSKELTQTKKQIDAISRIAHRDALTGIRNRTAYEEEVARLDRQAEISNKPFGFAVIDLNDLKRINDTYGHEQGNLAIKRCCRLICSVFAHSPVFRIGGDEFAVVLENEEYGNAHALVARFIDEIKKQEDDGATDVWEKFSAAIGYAAYDPSRDSGAGDVFKRADKAMYAHKSEMKSGRA
ncbi:MAG: GGDEF domain-containing protein [Oscillospiraceae bacterium]|jgi:diguanylate cyclase (GGDEF)-like protein|nr:GGDEF domain-containing protein [Oscillospiraceae bacterium]